MQRKLSPTPPLSTRIIDHLPEIYCQIDRNYRFGMVNRACLELLEKRGEEVLGKTVGEVVGEALFVQKLQPRLDRALDGDPVHFRERLALPGGSPNYLEIRYFPMFAEDSGEVSDVLVQAWDWSELAHAESANHAMESQLTTIKRINRLIGRETEPERLLERACAILLEDPAYRVVSLLGVDGKNGLERVVSCGLGGEAKAQFEQFVEASYPMACIREAERVGGPIRVEHEALTCANCPLSDLGLEGMSYLVSLEHDRQCYGYLMVWLGEAVAEERAESYLEEVAGDLGFSLHAMRLERERREAMAAMEQARLEAEKANRTKSRFLSTMTHEIRNPLNGILGMVEYLAEKDWDADTAECLQVLGTSSEILGGLIEEILDYSKIEAGRMAIRPAPTHLRLQLNDLVSLLRHRAGKDGHRLETELDFADQLYELDWPRVRQILLNLVGNAIKFTPKGGEIRLGVRAEVGGLVFEVRDNGIGIAAEAQEELFEPFAQGEQGAFGRSHGVGLGLAISKSLVERMGGTIAVESEAGQGCCFRFQIPVTW